jgi:hypothetical protein
MVYTATGAFLGTALANILAGLPRDKTNVVVVPQPGIDSELIKKFIPISRYAGFITCGAGTDMFNPDIEAVNQVNPVLLRVQVALSVAGVFKVVYKLGSDTSTYDFNSGVALAVNGLYIFDCLVHPNDKVNFQSSLAGIANVRIQEIALAIQ